MAMAQDSHVGGSRVEGMYVRGGRSASFAAHVVLDSDGGAWLYNADTQALVCHADAGVLRYASVIPGLPVDLIFADGGVFTPADVSFRWPSLSNTSLTPEWLERHWLVSLLSIVLIPAFLWIMVAQAIPAGARWSVAYLPDAVAREMGEQSLALLDQSWFQPTELDTETQQNILLQWQQVLLQLNFDPAQYRLNFRASDMGANAFALPNGTVVLTDDLVSLTKEHPYALTAILLHEIGHVDHRHGLQMVAQTTATSLLFAMMLGDMDGAADLVLGAGVGMAHTAFSRDMEREADAFAFDKLKQLDISPVAFADAMRLLMRSRGMNEQGKQPAMLRYISTHPGMEERIQAAEHASE